jgi:hypothetical protein
MLTAEVMRVTVDLPLHLRSREDLAGVWISSRSCWDSATWFLDNPSHGAEHASSSVNWAFEFDDGSNLLDPRHADLLDWLRRLVWSLMATPGDGTRALAPSTISQVRAGLSRTLPWLVANAIRWPHELTPEVLEMYLTDLPELLASNDIEEEGELERPHDGDEQDVETEASYFRDESDEKHEDSSVSFNTARLAINVIFYIWRQRKTLHQAGIQPMPAPPWPRHGNVNRIASKISVQMRGWIQPLPDEVAVLVLNKTLGFLITPADDILLLRDACEMAFQCETPDSTPYSRTGASTWSRGNRAVLAAQSFEFSVPEGDNAEWHSPLVGLTRATGSGTTTMLRVKQLVVHLQAACCLGLQTFTGMRVSELCGLRAGIDSETGLPAGVEKRLTPSGLDEEFVLWSELSKGQRSPRDVPWLLGLRRVGDPDWPIGVRCLQLLEELMAPYRILIGSDRLLVSIDSNTGLPKTSLGVGRMTGRQIRAIYRLYLAEWVDLSLLPDESRNALSANDLVRWRESKGSVITTHQLRNTYAQFVLSIDPRLLPAVKRQFHHQNMTITDHGYWGSNTVQVAPIKSVSRQITARQILSVVSGEARLTGRMGKQISNNLDEIRALVAGLDKRAAWVRVIHWLASNHVDAHHSPHGSCIPLALISRMECWKASGKHPVGPLKPNFATREASMCLGCACNSISENNIPFYQDRYIDNTVAVRLADQRERSQPQFRVIRNRAAQAQAVLKDVGVDTSALEARILERMTSHG